MLSQKNIILAISGGVSAYKVPHLVRLLIKEGAFVQTMMTKAARNFVTSFTLETLSRREVFQDIFSKSDLVTRTITHIEAAKWADVFVLVPATASMLAKITTGLCDDIVSLTFTAFPTSKPRIVVPAMDGEMYQARSVKENIRILINDGVQVISPQYGELASGDVGVGRMPSPENIVRSISDSLYQAETLLQGKRVVITAGPTREKIDTVRYLSNYSTGLMGFALAEAAKNMGAHVRLISGRSSLKSPKDVVRLNVETAEEMYRESLSCFANADIFIAAAAVSDYRPKSVLDKKLKRSIQASFQLELTQTKDILKAIGKVKKTNQFVVGFALEDDHEAQHAVDKLKEKRADMIILNKLSATSGFDVETNEGYVFFPDGSRMHLPLSKKLDMASKIMECISKKI